MTHTILILAIMAALALTACRPSQVTVSVTVPLGVKQNEMAHSDHDALGAKLRIPDVKRFNMPDGVGTYR
jgi:hypothetical protein